jgi:acyl-CoA synthetase (AMP-forming)/AMP-acid ligase II
MQSSGPHANPPVQRPCHRRIDADVLAILYTSGSTGRPKGVVLSHRNMVAGAKSVASYLGNHADDTLLAALPLSFDAGFSQLTTAFHAGARVVLLNYLLPRDVLKALERERVTGLTAVPPLYLQLAALEWPQAIGQHLRYFANTGGRMPRETLQALRQRVPQAQPFLMYGLTEAFRSTYLPPAEVDRRPDSIGRAIPNAEILVLREDGTECAADGASGRPGGPGLLERCRKDGRALQAFARGCRRPRGRLGAARDGRVFRGHRAPRCRGLSVLHRPA